MSGEHAEDPRSVLTLEFELMYGRLDLACVDPDAVAAISFTPQPAFIRRIYEKKVVR